MDSTINFVDFYKSYHTHWLNKMIHSVCIPLIVFTTINYLSIICQKYKLNHHYNLQTIITTAFCLNYFHNYNITAGVVMTMYISCFTFLSTLITELLVTEYKNLLKSYLLYNTIVFVVAWILQFIGHAIEGSRPALTDSLSQAVFQAPLFSLEYFLPVSLV